MRNDKISGLLSGLRDAGLLSDTDTQRLAHARGHLTSLVVEAELLTPSQLAEFCEAHYGLPLLDLHDFDLKEIPDKFIHEKLIDKHHALPIYTQGNTLYIAMADPTNVGALEDFGFHFAMRTEALLVEEDKLSKAISDLTEDALDSLDLGGISDADIADMDVAEERKDEGIEAKGDDQPIIAYINKILSDAIRKGASDLHFEPYEKKYRVRLRIDGILVEVAAPPVSLAGRLSARLKVMSKLDIAERRVPQDGRIKLTLSRNKSVDMRVSSLPTMWGEKIVIRILDGSQAMMGIDSLGYNPVQKTLYMDALGKPQGMILITGPTGSGKTVSLYTGLNILNTPEVNISTAEDPVEINLAGINQVQINTKAGLTFAGALRAFLRQDPDIVMVGEIRDLETAEIAIKAAQTGHLVLSTLHTNSTAETLTRLLNMGVPSYNIASTVTLIIAQRLARRLCKHCKAPDAIAQADLHQLGFSEAQLAEPFTIYKPVGCGQCTNGYKGRTGIYEVMQLSEEIARLIMEGGNSLQIAKQSQREGMLTLRQAGLEKVMLGVTSLAEVERVTSH